MQRVFFISPVLPRRDGPGLAQRAYRVIQALSRRCRVRLLTTENVEAEGAAVSDLVRRAYSPDARRRRVDDLLGAGVGAAAGA